MNADQEFELIRGFLRHQRRDRWRWGLGVATDGSPVSAKKQMTHRWKVVRRLSSGATSDFDPRYVERIPERQQFPEAILADLVGRGAPATCHVISDDDLDGRDLQLADVLEELYDRGVNGATLVICLPSRLAYFEHHEVHERYILERPASS